MPYIAQSHRKHLDPYINPLINELTEWKSGDGEINYVITKIIDGIYGKGDYVLMNRGIGVLDCAKEEFRRRRLNPYEDKKCAENCDVYQ